jgi:hypothetical protein
LKSGLADDASDSESEESISGGEEPDPIRQKLPENSISRGREKQPKISPVETSLYPHQERLRSIDQSTPQLKPELATLVRPPLSVVSSVPSSSSVPAPKVSLYTKPASDERDEVVKKMIRVSKSATSSPRTRTKSVPTPAVSMPDTRVGGRGPGQRYPRVLINGLIHYELVPNSSTQHEQEPSCDRGITKPPVEVLSGEDTSGYSLSPTEAEDTFSKDSFTTFTSGILSELHRGTSTPLYLS